MTRAELRRAQREERKKDKRYNLTKSQIKQLMTTDIDRISKESTDRAMEYILSLALLTLHDEFGFGEKRLERFCQRLSLKLKCAEDFTPMETAELLKEETGIDAIGRYTMQGVTDDDIKNLSKLCYENTGMEIKTEC